MQVALLAAFCFAASAQTPPARPSTSAPAAPVRRRPPDFPTRPPAEPAKVDRGKALYGVQCNFCHGSDARGGEGGPNLLRSEVVLRDKDGELIAPVLREGREGMPKFNLNESQVSDIAAFIHSFPVGGYDVSRMTPLTIVVGDAKAGQAYFARTCGKCHSAEGDLKGIASRIEDPKNLQQTWLIPGSGRAGGPGAAPVTRVSPTTVTVTLAGGTQVKGRLNRIDDFFVTLTDGEGQERTFTRNGDTPKVEVREPLQPHKQLLRTYTDKDVHDVTAYLVTLK